MLIKVRGKKYRPEAFFMIAPVLLLYTFVIIYPLGNMVFTSFFEWNGIPTDPYRFVGIGNYVTFFQDYTTKTAFINLGILCVTGLFVTIPVSLFLATVVSKKFFGIRFVKTCYFLPVVINRIAICLMFTFIMLPGQGPVPVLLKELGIAEHFNLFNDIHTAMWGVALVNMWSNVGFQMIIFSSGMAAISEDVYEAAAMDGVTPWQRLIYITLPQLKPTFKIVVVFVLTGAFKVFDFIMGLTGGGPGYATDVPNTLLYKNAFTYSKFGYANAIAVIMIVLCLVITVVTNRVFAERAGE
ncbi:multiple sugar transport system permease protein/raffinose/stachyose/melibiose transport system permease protein [Hungatella effluvii]|uniref:Multiple sugar transport system permease protein/raffinose/stachyose/melibiose transport system permease protein n=1 Tax=Hungatella effluvii TaxID=1096246 RepID=A0A2V3XWS8_9FIRM|nr:sugar ABC transporter permease [Hungatella effluvii]PXX48886.1 multiple sugar transport system permease protein/raffinose/stachyose/melibiose transport system permease protein [Hungatella effluvii]